jgi:hypothetical protein
MRLRLEPTALRVLGAMVAAGAAVILLHVANEVSGANKRLFDLDKEQNLPTWLSSVQLFSAALCSWLCSLRSTGRERLAWRGLAVIFAFLSLDELALVHEEVVEHVTDDPAADLWWWPVLYLPLAVAGLAALWFVIRAVRATLGSAALFLVGFAFLGVSLLLDSVATQYVDNEWLFSPSLVLEEAFELLGSALLVAVALAVYRLRTRAP